MKYNSISEIFEAFKGKTVLILGDVMVDSYLYGNVKLSEPDPLGPVLSASKREKRLGGAANVAMNVQALGATPILCSIVGDDKDGTILEQLLEYENMTSKGIIKSQNRVTTVKHRIFSGTQQMFRVDYEDAHSLIDLDRKSLLSHIKNLMEECDLIIFEDYDKGALDPIVIRETIKLARKKNIPTAVDPKDRNFLSYKDASLFKPNVKELKDGLGVEFDVDDIKEIEKAVEQLHKTIKSDSELLTLAGKGIFYQKGKDKGSYKAYLRKIVDVAGAGDTVISIAGLCLTLDLPISFMAELANLGGGMVCEYPGAVPVNRDQLLVEAESNPILKKYF
ncbi:MAG: bifunctional ADP-heptose synthase [Cyclobacteriaceae bacterium]